MSPLEEKRLLMAEYVKREAFLHEQLSQFEKELKELLVKKEALSADIQVMAKDGK